MAADFQIKSDPADVDVVGRKSIARWLTKRPGVLTPERVEEIFEQARRDPTWKLSPDRSSKRVAETLHYASPGSDTLTQLERLAALREQSVVNDEEFAELKRQIVMGRWCDPPARDRS